MKLLIGLVCLLFILYCMHIVICIIYCRAKKRKDAKRLVQQQNDDGNMDETILSNTNKSFSWKLKQLLNGYIMYSVSRLGRVPSQKYRIFMLKHVYQMHIEKNVVIYGDFMIRAPWNISIGAGTVIGDACSLDGRNGIVIGKNVNMSTAVYIYTEQHDINDPWFESRNSGGKVIVANRAWLSSRTTVLPKVVVGEGAVLASGGLAVKNLEPYGVYGGVPAKKIGTRNQNLKYEFSGAYLPFY